AAGAGAGLEADPVDRGRAQEGRGLWPANDQVVPHPRHAAGGGITMTGQNTPRISFIGFGEAGQAIASGLREGGIERITAWDILFPRAEGAGLKAAGEAMGVRIANSAADA